MTRSAFLYERGQLHNLHRARGLKAQIIGDKEITSSRHSSMPVHGVHQIQATLPCQGSAFLHEPRLVLTDVKEILMTKKRLDLRHRFKVFVSVGEHQNPNRHQLIYRS
jgi:hypothetical protein